jgi:tRNA wybutosine-synthesizing protein 1
MSSSLPDLGWEDILKAWHAYRAPLIAVAITYLAVHNLRQWSSGQGRESDAAALEEKAPPVPPKQKSTPELERAKLATPPDTPASIAATGPKPPPPAKTAVRQAGPKRIKGGLRQRSSPAIVAPPVEDGPPKPVQVLVFFSSITTSTERIAKDFAADIDREVRERPVEGREFLDARLLDLTEVELDDYFISPPKDVDALYLVLIPSYNIDTINDTFLDHLRETHNDFRIDTAPLASGILGYSVFGLGDRENWPTENDGFCFQAREVDKWLARLTGRKRAFPLGMGDTKTDYKARLAEWRTGVVEVLETVVRTGSLGEGVVGSGAPDESDDEDEGSASDGEAVVEDAEDAELMADLEDLGRMLRKDEEGGPPAKRPKAPLPVDFTGFGKTTDLMAPAAKPAKAPAVVKEMVPLNSPTYASLTKQGYSIVGTHSGVKICRWTKSALRGRGSCYKFSFYGINSHQCMETTPSLSCSSKCVFCWRKGTNPVGTTWRWVVDPPDLIFEGVKKNHYQKIKVLRGMAGVRADRYAEAQRIRHCALSLVGEPIFYPHINEFLAMLHAERISSFLVCNAQHPDQLAALKAVTQLYVSIDASNRDSLKRIDRPLFRDFWERFQACLDILREQRHRHRTVFRLTLVKGFNIDDEVSGYADLIERALPCFVEIKGVTFCGTSTAVGAGLRMTNVPFYWEVCEFVRALDAELKSRGLPYGIAAEHAHSCCVLIGSERFLVDGKWHTLIDYDKFFDLLETRGVDGEWTPEEYMGAPTPEWATWGNGGFDPRDERVDRKGRKIET